MKYSNLLTIHNRQMQLNNNLKGYTSKSVVRYTPFFNQVSTVLGLHSKNYLRNPIFLCNAFIQHILIKQYSLNHLNPGGVPLKTEKSKVSRGYTHLNQYNISAFVNSTIKSRSTPPMIKQWNNGVYNYNNNFNKNLPSANIMAYKFINAFFSAKHIEYNPFEKPTKLVIKRFFKYTLNIILVSKPEIKHFNNSINITFFLYNKRKFSLLKNLYDNMAINSLPFYLYKKYKKVYSKFRSVAFKFSRSATKKLDSGIVKSSLPLQTKKNLRNIALGNEKNQLKNSRKIKFFNYSKGKKILMKSNSPVYLPKNLDNYKNIGFRYNQNNFFSKYRGMPLSDLFKYRKFLSYRRNKFPKFTKSKFRNLIKYITRIKHRINHTNLLYINWILSKHYLNPNLNLIALKGTLLPKKIIDFKRKISFSSKNTVKHAFKSKSLKLKIKNILGIRFLSTQPIVRIKGIERIKREIPIVGKRRKTRKIHAMGIIPIVRFRKKKLYNLNSIIFNLNNIKLIKNTTKKKLISSLSLRHYLKKNYTFKKIIKSKKSDRGMPLFLFKGNQFFLTFKLKYILSIINSNKYTSLKYYILNNKYKLKGYPLKKQLHMNTHNRKIKQKKSKFYSSMILNSYCSKIKKIDFFIDKYILKGNKGININTTPIKSMPLKMLSLSRYNTLKTKFKLNYLKSLILKETLYLDYLMLLTYNNSMYKSWYLTPLKAILSKIYNKKVNFNFVNLKRIYFNSDILTQAIKLKLQNLKKNRLNRVLRKVLNIVAIAKINRYTLNLTSPSYKYIGNYYNRYKILNNTIFRKELYYPLNKLNNIEVKGGSRFLTSKNGGFATSPLNEYNSLSLLSSKDILLNYSNKNTSFKQSRGLKKEYNIMFSSYFKNNQPNILPISKKNNIFYSTSLFLKKKLPYNLKDGFMSSYKGRKIKWLNYIQSNAINLIKYKKVTGIKLEASGRLSRRSTADRSVFKTVIKGNLRNNFNATKDINPRIKYNVSPLISNIQYSKLQSKTRNGSFGIKTWLVNN